MSFIALLFVSVVAGCAGAMTGLRGGIALIPALTLLGRGCRYHGRDSQRTLCAVSAYAPAWGDHVASLITHRHPYTDSATALQQHPDDEIKSVVEWSKR